MLVLVEVVVLTEGVAGVSLREAAMALANPSSSSSYVTLLVVLVVVEEGTDVMLRKVEGESLCGRIVELLLLSDVLVEVCV